MQLLLFKVQVTRNAIGTYPPLSRHGNRVNI